MPGMQIVGVATAPVSFGVFEELGSGTPRDDNADALLAAMAKAGYSGSELGPPGFFGPPHVVRERFARHQLRVVGAYVPLHLADPSQRANDLRVMTQTLGELAGAPDACAVLADWGSPTLQANPARPWDDRSLALDDAAWAHAADTLVRAVGIATDLGIAATFHPHIATYVEAPWEIERLLDTVDIGLTIDTGHLFLAGASPTGVLERWSPRVRHVHLKDVRRAVMDEAKAACRDDLEAWWADVACPLGEGNVDLDGFLEVLRGTGYRGWLVVEQDRAPSTPAEIGEIGRQQAENLEWVRRRLMPGELVSGAVSVSPR